MEHLKETMNLHNKWLGQGAGKLRLLLPKICHKFETSVTLLRCYEPQLQFTRGYNNEKLSQKFGPGPSHYTPS